MFYKNYGENTGTFHQILRCMNFLASYSPIWLGFKNLANDFDLEIDWLRHGEARSTEPNYITFYFIYLG